MLIPSYPIIIPDSTRKGKRDGKTLKKKSDAPDIALVIHVFGSIIIIKIIIEEIIVIRVFLSFKSTAISTKIHEISIKKIIFNLTNLRNAIVKYIVICS